MTAIERTRADYAGTSLTIGPHPMSFCRRDLALRGVQRAIDLPAGRAGRRVRVAGAVITRQRPGTAKGFVFLTLEDETGIANIIVRPDLYSHYRTTVLGAPYLLVEGMLQIQDGVTSVKAEESIRWRPAVRSRNRTIIASRSSSVCFSSGVALAPIARMDRECSCRAHPHGPDGSLLHSWAASVALAGFSSALGSVAACSRPIQSTTTGPLDSGPTRAALDRAARVARPLLGRWR